MKKSTLYTIIISLLLAVLLFSCEQPKNEVPVQQYSTPTIVGRITLPSGSTVNASDIYVKVVDESGNTAKVDKVKSDKSFVIQGLKEGTKYSILFTSEEPEFNNRSLSRDPEKSQGVGGWIHDVLPSIKEGNDVGSVKLKPLGTIKGKALIDKAEEHYDITVYIPGTSYIARTDADGTFSIYNVAEGTYKLRYTLDNHMPVMVEDVILTCPEEIENPEVVVKDVTLISNVAKVEGFAILDGEEDNSNISVKLEKEDKSKSYSQATSPDGSYIFDLVEPGRYRILASSTGYLSQASGYFNVEAATITAVSEKLTLFKNIGTITGKITLGDSNSTSAGVTISISSENGNYAVVTDKDGYFTKNVKPGTYRVTASYPGYTSQSQEVTILENTITEITIPTLPLASGAIAGTVILSESEDYSGVVVTLTNSDLATEVYTEVSAVDGTYRFSGLKKGGTLDYDGAVELMSRYENIYKSFKYALDGIWCYDGKSELKNTEDRVELNDIPIHSHPDTKAEALTHPFASSLPGGDVLGIFKEGSEYKVSE